MNLKEKKVLIPIILGILLIVVAIGGYIFAKKACVANIEEQYKEELQALKEIANYDDIDCNPFSKSVSIKNIKAKDGELFIKEIVFSKLNEDKELNIPLSMSIKAKGVKAKDENGEVQEGDVDLSYKLDLKKEEMDFSMGVSVKNEGKYKIDILFGDIDRDTLKILNEAIKDKNLQNKKPEENLDLIMTLGKISIKKFKFSFGILIPRSIWHNISPTNRIYNEKHRLLYTQFIFPQHLQYIPNIRPKPIPHIYLSCDVIFYKIHYWPSISFILCPHHSCF